MMKVLTVIFFSILLLAACSSSEEPLTIGDDFGFKVVSWERINEINGVSLDLAFRLHIDNNATLWVGTYGNGLIRIDENAQAFRTDNSNLPNDTIWSLASDRNAVLWSGTSGGLVKLDGGEMTHYHTGNSPMVLDFVYALAIDPANHVWLSNGSAEQGGLLQFDQQDEWNLFTPANSSLPTPIINAIQIDQDGTIWTGHGMFQGDGGVWTKSVDGQERVYTTTNSDLNYNWISQLENSPTGEVWLGTDMPIRLDGATLDGGIQVFQEGAFVSHNPAASGKTTNRVQGMAFDERGNLWVSTGLDAPTFDLSDEIAVYNQQEWLVLSEVVAGFPNVRVTDMVIHDQQVWMATADGLLLVTIEYD